MLEMHYTNSKTEISLRNKKHLKVKWLLDEILDSLKFGDETEEYKIPEALLEKKKSVVSIVEAGSLDALPDTYKAILDQEYFESKNTIETILYVKALLNVTEFKKKEILGFSEQEEAYKLLDKEIKTINKEIRDLINQIFTTLVRNRTIPELFFGEHMHFNRDAQLWAISTIRKKFKS